MPYNYTIPRTAVAGMFKSPGPVYTLPALVGYKDHDPRSVHTRGPAFQFGLRHKLYTTDSSPGPKYFPDPKMLNNGRDAIPAFTVAARPTAEGGKFHSPGPAAYNPSMRPVLERPPEFKFGTKHMEARMDTLPGPNQYKVPPLVGRPVIDSTKPSAPQFTIPSRLDEIGTTGKSPGPGEYKNVSTNYYKNRPPQFTMASRTFMPGDRTQVPGPGAYSPELVKVNRPIAPRFTFGIRHSEYEGTSNAPVDDYTCP